jgi:hypothetical protein
VIPVEMKPGLVVGDHLYTCTVHSGGKKDHEWGFWPNSWPISHHG